MSLRTSAAQPSCLLKKFIIIESRLWHECQGYNESTWSSLRGDGNGFSWHLFSFFSIIISLASSAAWLWTEQLWVSNTNWCNSLATETEMFRNQRHLGFCFILTPEHVKDSGVRGQCCDILLLKPLLHSLRINAKLSSILFYFILLGSILITLPILFYSILLSILVTLRCSTLPFLFYYFILLYSTLFYLNCSILLLYLLYLF